MLYAHHLRKAQRTTIIIIMTNLADSKYFLSYNIQHQFVDIKVFLMSWDKCQSLISGTCHPPDIFHCKQ